MELQTRESQCRMKYRKNEYRVAIPLYPRKKPTDLNSWWNQPKERNQKRALWKNTLRV